MADEIERKRLEEAERMKKAKDAYEKKKEMLIEKHKK